MVLLDVAVEALRRRTKTKGCLGALLVVEEGLGRVKIVAPARRIVDVLISDCGVCKEKEYQ